MPPRDAYDRISGMCWDGKHHRCSGWMVVPSYAHKTHGKEILSVRCECETCVHPPVESDRHVKEITAWN